MRSITVSRPTPAFVLAFVALLCSLAGTGYAAATISGKSIVKKSVPANRVMDDVLGGKQINESKLKLVPLAAQAQLADSAKVAQEADHAKNADQATNAAQADKATQAETAADADKLGGKLPASYMRSSRVVRSKLVQDVAPNIGVEESVSCQDDERLISGGAAFYIQNTNTTVGSATLSANLPITNQFGLMTAWRGEGKNTSPVARDFRVFAVCAVA